MAPHKLREQTKFWPAPDIGDMELLKATYITHTFSKHVHVGYVIGVIETGAQGFQYRGRKHYAPAGSIVVINPETVHTGHAADLNGWTYRMMYPGPDLIRDVARQMGDESGRQPYFPQAVIEDAALAKLLHRTHLMLETSRSTLARESTFTWAMGQLIARHAQRCPRIDRTAGDHRAVRRLKSFMQSRYGDNLTLGQLSAEVDLSPFYLTRLFTRSTGLPPHAYLTQVRIEKAKVLLRREMPIPEVALETGFVDQSHLNRHFKRIVGVPPGQYHRQWTACGGV